MKEEDCCFRLQIATCNAQQVETLNSVLGMKGNISNAQTWADTEKESEKLLFGAILDKYIRLIEKHHEELCELDFYEGVTLFVEYFSKEYLSTELVPGSLLKMGELNIRLCINHILMYPSILQETVVNTNKYNVKEQDTYVRLKISAYHPQAVEILNSIFGMKGNISDEDTWIDYKQTGEDLPSDAIRDKYIDLIEQHHKALCELDYYHGSGLFLEYFSEDDLFTEFNASTLAKMGKLEISLCMNHILMYPSIP